MKNFEMPKMNVSVFSSENIITTSGGVTPTKVSQSELAQRALGEIATQTVAANSGDWIDA